MAIGTPTAPTTQVGAAATTATTASFTPSASVALLAFATVRRTGGAATTPTVSDSLGLTWSPLEDVNYDPGSNPRMAAQVYIAFPGASPSAMTVTSDSTNGSQTGITLVEVTGASQTAGDYTNVVVSSVSTTGDPSATLPSSPAASSGVIGLAIMNPGNIITSPTGFTQIEEATLGGQYRVESSYDITSPTDGPHAWSSSNATAFGFLIEIPEPSSGATHAATGALTGQGSTIAGTSAHIATHTSTGALSGQGAAVAGAATSFTVHATSGALVGQGSTVAGTAAHRALHASTGALTGQGSTLAGSATRTRQHATTGVLAGQGAALAGSAARTRQHTSTGVLTGAGSTIAGSADHISGSASHSATGTLTGQGAVLTGISVRYRLHAGSGALAGAGSSLAGVAVHRALHTSSGALVGQGSVVAGSAAKEGGAWIITPNPSPFPITLTPSSVSGAFVLTPETTSDVWTVT